MQWRRRRTNGGTLGWVGGLAGTAALGLAFAACAPAEGDAGADGAEDLNVRVINIEVTPVSRGTFTGYIRVTGEVEALYDVTVAAEETGRVEEVLARKGRRVTRGQPLVRLEAELLSAQVAEARAAAQLAREEWERQRQLWEQDSIGTELAYLQRRYQSEIAAARLAQLESRLERTVIRAPVAGVFDDRYVELGEMATAGMPVARVVTINQVKVSAGVPERFAPSVARRDSAQVGFDIFPGREFVGLVNFVGASVDPANRTFPIEILLQNPEGLMKPAMVATVRVQRERLDDVIVVPQQVVLRSADGYKLFVAEQVENHYEARARTVVLGPTSGNTVVIVEGLAVDDLLITLGQQLVDDGSRVRIVNTATAQAGGAKE
jgi:membrane fusion protein (multidrug efflux system)